MIKRWKVIAWMETKIRIHVKTPIAADILFASAQEINKLTPAAAPIQKIFYLGQVFDAQGRRAFA